MNAIDWISPWFDGRAEIARLKAENASLRAEIEGNFHAYAALHAINEELRASRDRLSAAVSAALHALGGAS